MVREHEHDDGGLSPAERDSYDEFEEGVTRLWRRIGRWWQRHVKKDWKRTKFHDKLNVIIALGALLVLVIYTIATIKMYGVNKQAANAATAAVELSRKQLEISERPWVRLDIGQMKVQQESPVLVPFSFTNTGKTAARKINVTVVVHLLAQGEKPEFTYEHGNGTQVGLMEPNTNEPNNGFFYSKLIPNTQGPTKPEPIIITKPLLDVLGRGDSFIIAYGRVTYCDALDVFHWHTACVIGTSIHGLRVPDECLAYNNADGNDTPTDYCK